jgi:hypothetical protein
MADEPTEPPDDEVRDNEGDEYRGEAPRAGRRRQRQPARARRRKRGPEKDEHDDPRAFAVIIERRWAGSAAPTAERYALALQQWAALPGAVAAAQTTAIAPAPPGDRQPSTEAGVAAADRTEP